MRTVTCRAYCERLAGVRPAPWLEGGGAWGGGERQRLALDWDGGASLDVRGDYPVGGGAGGCPWLAGSSCATRDAPAPACCRHGNRRARNSGCSSQKRSQCRLQTEQTSDYNTHTDTVNTTDK